jgi:transcriptional regulator with XRE-family HTH domain
VARPDDLDDPDDPGDPGDPGDEERLPPMPQAISPWEDEHAAAAPMPDLLSAGDRAAPPAPPMPSEASPTAAPRHSIGAGYLILVARELTGLSQRALAARAGTSQPALARLETGARIPSVRTMLRVADAAGFELLLGLREFDSDPPAPEALDGVTLLGALVRDPADDLADFVVLREPSVFDGPPDR